jgi:putative oxidoreductase
MKYIFLLGRILFSSIFIIRGFCHFTQNAMEHAISVSLPMPSILVPLSGILSLIGGVSLLLGYKARLGAWILIVFLIPVTYFMHQYWTGTDMFSTMMHQFCFMKNVSLIGTCLMLTYFGSGPLSLKH